MLTPEEALAAINPALPPDERIEQANRLISSSVALDAYLDSRSQLEQIVARAQGHGQVVPFDQINPNGVGAGSAEAPAAPAAPAAAELQSGAASGDVTDAQVVEDPKDLEIKALEERLATLRGGGS